MHEKFAAQLTIRLKKIPTAKAAKLCGVTVRSVQLWRRGKRNVNRATQVGVITILDRAHKQRRKEAA